MLFFSGKDVWNLTPRFFWDAWLNVISIWTRTENQHYTVSQNRDTWFFYNLIFTQIKTYNRIQSPSHCLSVYSHAPETHHLGLRPREHKYPLLFDQTTSVKKLLFLDTYFDFYDLCVIVSGILTFAFVICFTNQEKEISYHCDLLLSRTH